MNLEALLATAQRQGIELWLDGEQVRCKAAGKVSKEMITRMRSHKGEIIRILQGGAPSTRETPELPPWCSTDCQYLDLVELPGEQRKVPACFREDGAGGWVWSRLDKLNGCPAIKAALPHLPFLCNRQCPHYRPALANAPLAERCHWQDKTGRHWVRLRIEQLLHCPAKAEKSNRVKN